MEELRRLVEEHSLAERVNLCGTFCMGKCEQGVCVTVDGELFSVQPDNVKQFFEKNILTKI